jgi:hypothetical protein
MKNEELFPTLAVAVFIMFLLFVLYQAITTPSKNVYYDGDTRVIIVKGCHYIDSDPPTHLANCPNHYYEKLHTGIPAKP